MDFAARGAERVVRLRSSPSDRPALVRLPSGELGGPAQELRQGPGATSARPRTTIRTDRRLERGSPPGGDPQDVPGCSSGDPRVRESRMMGTRLQIPGYEILGEIGKG